jgi:hypothetical protein
MWKKLAMTAAAVLGMAAPMVAQADEPCAQEQAAYVQPAGFVEAGVARPIQADRYYGRDRRDDYLRMRQRERWEHARRWEGREHRYGRRW